MALTDIEKTQTLKLADILEASVKELRQHVENHATVGLADVCYSLCDIKENAEANAAIILSILDLRKQAGTPCDCSVCLKNGSEMKAAEPVTVPDDSATTAPTVRDVSLN